MNNVKHIRALLVIFTVVVFLFHGVEPVRAAEQQVFSKNRNAEKKVALTFDDGPHPILTPRILAILSQYHVKATFFVIGQNVKYYPDPIRQILDAGCEIGSHTYGHSDVGRLSESEIRRELIQTEQALCEECEYPIRLFRPPQGSYGNALLKVALEMDYKTVLWSIDTEDWAHKSAQEIAKCVTERIENGDIILMHDFIGRDSNTCEALEIFIPILLERGYEFVTVSELLA